MLTTINRLMMQSISRATSSTKKLQLQLQSNSKSQINSINILSPKNSSPAIPLSHHRSLIKFE